jgi:hypothetical protein
MSKVNITPYLITFTAASIYVLGVYFPLTLIADTDITTYLASLYSLSVVIGNINVCFRNSLL